MDLKGTDDFHFLMRTGFRDVFSGWYSSYTVYSELWLYFTLRSSCVSRRDAKAQRQRRRGKSSVIAKKIFPHGAQRHPAIAGFSPACGEAGIPTFSHSHIPTLTSSHAQKKLYQESWNGQSGSSIRTFIYGMAQVVA